MRSGANAFVESLIACDRTRASSLARTALAASHDASSFYVDFVQAALYEVGRRWEGNELTVAQEHGATATAQFVLGSVFAEVPRAETRRGSAVIAGIRGERHQIGAHIVSDVLEADGWDVHFLGADVPIDALVAASAEHDARLVGLSVTMPAQLPNLIDAVARLRAALGLDVVVIAGGQGCLPQYPIPGLSGFAHDAVEARRLARELAA